MENLFAEDFSVGLEDFSLPKVGLRNTSKDINVVSPFLHHLRSTQNELVDLQLEHYIRHMRVPVADFILKAFVLGDLIQTPNFLRAYIYLSVIRQRLELFTSKEQDILSVVEPIMKSIRRIMHLSGSASTILSWTADVSILYRQMARGRISRITTSFEENTLTLLMNLFLNISNAK